MYVKWDESYSNGIELFDEQHKGLFRLINDLHEGIRQKKNREALGTALVALMDYIKIHFADEENAMRLAGYPGYEEHLSQHVAFIAQVGDIRDRYLNGEPVMTMELVALLVNWLKKHIQTVDRAYGPYLKTAGA